MGCFWSKKILAASVAVSGLCMAYAADWYAKDPKWGSHDPAIVRYEDGYALMTTNNHLLMQGSEDALNWTNYKQAMPTFPSWLKNVANGMEDIWAPDLFNFGGDYRIYYCGSVFGKRSSGIGYMSSKSVNPNSPDYGWTDKGEVIHTVATDKYNAIDADVMRDVDGNYWMAFGSFGLGIQVIKIDGTSGKRVGNDMYNVARRTTKASNGAVEGPSFIEHGGKYFLFTAWDVCCQQGPDIENSTYKTAMGRADKPQGPYYDRAGKDLAENGGTILLERYGRYYGPGGGDVFQDLNRVRFVHHYYDNGGDKYAHIHVRDVVFTDDNWAEMGQPFLGRYLSAEAEHGTATRAVSGDLKITNSTTASNGEYMAYINTNGSKIRLPMNIQQAGDYFIRYRYANGDAADATHNLTVNGKAQVVKLPPTGAWGTFPEKSTVNIPVSLKRGGNFIEVAPGENFAELDRLDFLRIIRDTIPANGFDNGIRVRLDEKDQFAIKDGGYAIFENVVTDSIKSTEVHVQMKNCAGGTLSLRAESKKGTEISKCSIPTTCGNEAWVDVKCSDLPKLEGVQDFYVTATGITDELLVGNIKFVTSAAEPAEDTSKTETKDPASDTTGSVQDPDKTDSTTTIVAENRPAVAPALLMHYDASARTVRMSRAAKWNVMDLKGSVVASGFGSEVRMGEIRRGTYLVKCESTMIRVMNR
ncbi:MAG: family 43 glycosylhydrolase [Fibrobacter sp.]|nr:family 43 glycosylhydrolase [Fibrobacter sp.]